MAPTPPKKAPAAAARKARKEPGNVAERKARKEPRGIAERKEPGDTANAGVATADAAPEVPAPTAAEKRASSKKRGEEKFSAADRACVRKQSAASATASAVPNELRQNKSADEAKRGAAAGVTSADAKEELRQNKPAEEAKRGAAAGVTSADAMKEGAKQAPEQRQRAQGKAESGGRAKEQTLMGKVRPPKAAVNPKKRKAAVAAPPPSRKRVTVGPKSVKSGKKGGADQEKTEEVKGLASYDEVDRAVALGDALFVGGDEDVELSVGESASEDDDGDGEVSGEGKELSRRDLLKGIDVSDSSDGEDSSDDERAQELRTGGAHKVVGKVDKQDDFAQGHHVIALDSMKGVDFKKKLQDVKPASNAKRGVVYLGRIPAGFHEDQMRGYFSQFGEVTRLRLSRNKKTGRSKHYAFIEFRSEDVAKIICDTMHNYLLAGRLLQCKLVPAASVHPMTFVGANKRYHVVDHYAIARTRHNAEKTEEGIRRARRKERAVAKKKAEKLKKSGIDYQFDE